MNIFTVSVPTQAVLCQICITCQVYVSYIRYHWFCIVTNPIIFCNILMSVGQPYETFGNKAEDQLTSFPRLSYIICMYNIHPRTQKTSCFHFHHFVIELKPYIHRWRSMTYEMSQLCRKKLPICNKMMSFFMGRSNTTDTTLNIQFWENHHWQVKYYITPMFICVEWS